MNLWREGKLSHCACVTDLFLCREPCSLRLVAIVQGFQAKELADWIERSALAQGLKCFRDWPRTGAPDS